MKFKLYNEKYAVCRLDCTEKIPTWINIEKTVKVLIDNGYDIE